MKDSKTYTSFDLYQEKEEYKKLSKKKSQKYSSFFIWHNSILDKLMLMDEQDFYDLKIRCLNQRYLSANDDSLLTTVTISYLTLSLSFIVDLHKPSLTDLNPDVVLTIILLALIFGCGYVIMKNKQFRAEYTFYDNLISIIDEIEIKRKKAVKTLTKPRCCKRKYMHKACKKSLG